MRLATLATAAGPRPAVRAGDDYIDLLAADPKLPSTVRGLLTAGSDALGAVRRIAGRNDAGRVPAAAARFHAPVTDPAKIICLGLNYRDHALESGRQIPNEPVLFSKYATSLIGHREVIVLPKVSKRVDYEAELVAVIGRKGRHIPVDKAMQYVAGYCVGHDVSARDWQFKGETKQWMSGKTFDTFAPLGPDLVTADEVPDPHNLPIRLKLNGEVMQDSNTKQLIFGVPEIVAYLSIIVTLEPGDLIYTGTPPGVGDARKPPVYMKPGDVAVVEIDGLGVLENTCVAEE
jgi:2-keto-4-pentenoate hydratase/2-oxohepta-3-ene-1,7-dioic acid hydratase in catechol pathway